MPDVPSSDRNQEHILLVDDNRLGLAARKAVLEELGYRITPARSAIEALTLFEEGEFALVITDYRMPRMDGLELILRIRKRSPAIPVVLLSGFVDTLGLECGNTGADIVIQKSANEVNLMVRAVRRLLRARRKPMQGHYNPAKDGGQCAG